MLQLATEYDFSIAFERLWDLPSSCLLNDKADSMSAAVAAAFMCAACPAGDEFRQSLIEEIDDIFLDGNSICLKDAYSGIGEFHKRAIAYAPSDYYIDCLAPERPEGVAFSVKVIEVLIVK